MMDGSISEIEGIPPEKLEYLSKVKICIVGSGGILVELLKRWNFKEIRVMEGEVAPEDVRLDPFYDEEMIGAVPKYASSEKTCVSTLLPPPSVDEFKLGLRCIDIVIGGYDEETLRLAATASRDMGIPLITWGYVTTLLPDGIPLEEIEFPEIKLESVSATFNVLVRALQCYEAVKLFTGVGEPVFPPEAVEVDALNLRLRKVRLSVKGVVP